MRTVAVLCAARKSVYHGMPAVEVYDSSRDAFTFPGGMPVVAHPPCRLWSAFTRHQAKPALGGHERERELGLWCCGQLRACGGVLEQPAHSHLWVAAGFPRPGQPEANGVWSLEVWQAWWGYPVKKATWLAFCGVPKDAVVTPYRLHAKGKDHRRQQLMSRRERSATTLEFAEWLIQLARLSRSPKPMPQ